MKALTIMPNFMIMAEVSNEHYMENLFGILRCFCEVEANVEHMDSYRITPKSFWEGMNAVPDVDFIQLLKDNVETEIPSNVLTDLEKFKTRFGLITQIGDDCLKVKDKDVLTEIKHNTKLNEMIYEYDDDLIFFEGDINLIQSVLDNDLFCPIKFRVSKMKTYILNSWDKSILVKAANPLQALRSLYNNHEVVNEEQLRLLMKNRKAEITEESINEFIQLVLNQSQKYFTYFIQVSDKANRIPFSF